MDVGDVTDFSTGELNISYLLSIPDSEFNSIMFSSNSQNNNAIAVTNANHDTSGIIGQDHSALSDIHSMDRVRSLDILKQLRIMRQEGSLLWDKGPASGFETHWFQCIVEKAQHYANLYRELRDFPADLNKDGEPKSIKIPIISISSPKMYSKNENSKFHLTIPSECKNAKYSQKLNKLYVVPDKTFALEFNFCLEEDVEANDLAIRAIPKYCNAEDSDKAVKICPKHLKGNDIDETSPNNVIIWCENFSNYVIDGKSKFPSCWTNLRAFSCGKNSTMLLYKFLCSNSCGGGMERRPIFIHFTLENYDGTVLGEYLLKVRVCSCPKRDMDKEEQECDKKQLKRNPNEQNENQPDSTGLSSCKKFKYQSNVEECAVLSSSSSIRNIALQIKQLSEELIRIPQDATKNV